MIRRPGAFSSRAISLLLALLITGCSAGFEEGAYVDPRTGTAYEFGKDGQGRVIGGVPGAPGFTYKVEGDRVVMHYAGMSGASTAFRRIDRETLERPDGARLMLQD